MLVPCDDLYNYEEFNFSAKALEQKFEAMRENYSNIFVNFLKLMTNEQEEMRLDFIGLNDQLDKILKMNKEDVILFCYFFIKLFILLYIFQKKNPIFRKKTSDESLKLDKNIMNRLSKDLDLGINSYPQTSLIPFQNKRMTSNEILLNQWKFDPKLRETNLQASISKNPKMLISYILFYCKLFLF